MGMLRANRSSEQDSPLGGLHHTSVFLVKEVGNTKKKKNHTNTCQRYILFLFWLHPLRSLSLFILWISLYTHIHILSHKWIHIIPIIL